MDTWKLTGKHRLQHATGYRTIPVASHRVGPSISDETIDIPESLSSRECLAYLGFADEVTTEIYQAWSIRGDRESTPLKDGLENIRKKAQDKDAVKESDDYAAPLNTRACLQTAFVASSIPEFDEIRVTAPASLWASAM